MKRLAVLAIACLPFGVLLAQTEREVMVGNVTYVTSTNAYVKFENTAAVIVGDTLFAQVNGAERPVLVVNAKSSTNCVGTILPGTNITKGLQITHSSTKKDEKSSEEVVPVAVPIPTEPTPKPVTTQPKRELAQNVTGRIQLANFSNFGLSSNTSNHRQMATLQLKVREIGVQGLWAEFYANYWLVMPSAPSQELTNSSMPRIFNAAINYDFKRGCRISVGRKYSAKLNSIGSIDGVQAEKSFKNFYVGAMAGFRPDLITFGFNSSLFQYGAYVGYQNNKGKYTSTTTLGYVEQTNNGSTDRRYAALQHDGNLGKLNLFASTELDLYNPINNTLRLTSLYLSANYRLTKKARLMLSYDTRKSIVYYQSDFSTINQYPFGDIGRQGLRARFNYTFTTKLSAGVGANIRFQSNNLNQSTNYNGFLTYRFSNNGGRLNVALGYNTTSSLHYLMPSVTYSRGFIDQKLHLNAFYRLQNFSYVEWNKDDVFNHIIGLGANAQLSKKMNLNLFGEYSLTSTGDYVRINLSLSYRI